MVTQIVLIIMTIASVKLGTHSVNSIYKNVVRINKAAELKVNRFPTCSQMNPVPAPLTKILNKYKSRY